MTTIDRHQLTVESLIWATGLPEPKDPDEAIAYHRLMDAVRLLLKHPQVMESLQATDAEGVTMRATPIMWCDVHDHVPALISDEREYSCVSTQAVLLTPEEVKW